VRLHKSLIVANAHTTFVNKPFLKNQCIGSVFNWVSGSGLRIRIRTQARPKMSSKGKKGRNFMFEDPGSP
jgi:hypothetical protein